MKMKILSEKENPLMDRREIQVEIEHDKECTPSKAQVQALLSAELKKGLEHIDVRNVFSDNGKPVSASKVFVWKEKKAVDLSTVKKGKAAEAEKKEEKK